MSRVVPAAKQLAVGVAAAAVLSLGVGGLAGAATTAPSSTPCSGDDTHDAGPHRHFNCARAPRALARIQRTEARIKAGLPSSKPPSRRPRPPATPRRRTASSAGSAA